MNGMIIGGIVMLSACKSEPNPQTPNKAQQGPAQPLSVSAYIPQYEISKDALQLTGSILAFEETPLFTESSGRIIQLHLPEGKSVKKSTLLVKLNDDELQAQAEKLEVDLRIAKSNLVRQKALRAINANSAEEEETAQNAVDVIIAQQKIIQTQRAKFELRAPFDGVLGFSNLTVGAYVQPTTMLTTIRAIDKVKLEFSIPEKYAHQIKVGNQIQFSIVGLDRNYSAKVYAIDPQIDLNTRTLKVRAEVPNQDRKLLPGAFAQIELVLGQTDKALFVPSQAIISDIKGQKIFVVRNNTAVPTAVLPGYRTSDRIQIVEGIRQGDTVITTGLLQLKPDMPVQVTVNPSK